MMRNLVVSAAAHEDLLLALERCRKIYPHDLQRLRDTLVAVLDEIEEAPRRWAIWRPPILHGLPP